MPVTNPQIPLFAKVESIVAPLSNTFDNKLFLTQLNKPSTIYKANDLLSALQIVANEPGVAGKTFYLGEENVNLGWEYGLVNLAAFLAQCMKETIPYDACDENNWDMIDGKYPLSNACGQLKQSYQDYNCPAGEEHMQCPVDPNMLITATTHATWYGAPQPLFCGPKSNYPYTGFWNHGYMCNNSWKNPPEYCDAYEGQKAGGMDNTQAVASRGGRTDVEGCCWWGRGVIQTTGVCNYGKLNYYLGARAAQDGRNSRYPDIDFCKTPDKICGDPNYPELKWIAGFFYWMESVQSYDQGGWNYPDELRQFVNEGMSGTGFIDAVSGIVNRGCHNPPCATGEVDGKNERREYFKKVLTAMCLPTDGNENRPCSKGTLSKVQNAMDDTGMVESKGSGANDIDTSSIGTSDKSQNAQDENQTAKANVNNPEFFPIKPILLQEPPTRAPSDKVDENSHVLLSSHTYRRSYTSAMWATFVSVLVWYLIYGY